ncbi:MAG: UPF0158 family protein [Prolixibacteraceae bacterium]|nr:UPF0158 family protein [Prolixibacteraceae bacterium]
MDAQQLLNGILPILHSVKEDKEKLQRILDFLLEEIYENSIEEEPKVPEKYRELVKSIAQNIDCGSVCFINPETLEVEEIPKTMLDDPYEYKMHTGTDSDQQTFLHEDWETYIRFDPRESHESFGIMEGFIDQLNDKTLKNKLQNALNNRKPFANFKNIIETSSIRQVWFDYKQGQLEKMVWKELAYELEHLEENIKKYCEGINGFYNDDGTKIDPDSVPVPGLCIICRKHQIDDWDENLLCLMNRNDQRNESDFKCGAFEMIC